MSKIIPISITTTEQTVELDATYQFVWLRNMGENDVLLSDHSGIVAGDDDVMTVKAGESGRISTSGRAVYIKTVSGTSTGEIHAQNFSDVPFKSKAKGGGQTITVEPLTVNNNGVYTAPTGKAYNPVTVDTGIYVGTENPTASLGNDGDYYYKRANSFTAYELESPNYGTSSNTWIGFDFTLSTTISITKMSTCLTDATNFKFCIGTENELVYESSEITGISGVNELILPSTVELLPNVRYTAYIKMDSNKGQYFGQSKMVNFGKALTFICGRYGTGTYRPGNTDSSDGYRVNFDYTTNDYLVKAEYRKKSGSWLEL